MNGLGKGVKITDKLKSRNRIGNKGLINQQTAPTVARKSSRSKKKAADDSKYSSANTTGGISSFFNLDQMNKYSQVPRTDQNSQ